MVQLEEAGLQEPPRKRLLILSCSQRKRPDSGLLPAVERYDGPAFRVLRCFLREKFPDGLDVYVLSAEFGLIAGDTLIPDYDRRMSTGRAHELREQVVSGLEPALSSGSYAEAFASVGPVYSETLGLRDLPSISDVQIEVSNGSPGRRQAELHDWLHGHPPMLRYGQSASLEKDRPSIKGVEVALTREQALEEAKCALTEGWGSSQRYVSWCVNVEGRRVAPKWLVSLVSGLPTSSFSTHQALKLLRELGVEPERAW